PLRSDDDVAALIEGLKDGTIEILSSDHQPYADEKKAGEILSDPAGATGLETLLPVCIAALIEPEHLTWGQMLATLTVNPATLLGLDAGTLRPGAIADVAILDPHATWTIDPRNFRSRGRNTPFAGRTVRGRIDATI